MPKKPSKNVNKQKTVEIPVSSNFDNIPILQLIDDYFGGDDATMRKYLERKNEEDALWRLNNYRKYELDDEVEDFETTRREVEERMAKEAKQASLRASDEWANWDIVHALAAYLKSEDEMDENLDIYNLYYSGAELISKLHRFYNGKRTWLICLEDDLNFIAKKFVKNYIDTEGIMNMTLSFVESHIDGDKVADYFEDGEREDVEENPDVYLDEKEDRHLSKRQERELTDLRDQIATLEKERDELDTDTPEEEQRYEEINDEISDKESEIEDIQDSPDGDWDESKIEEVVEDRLRDIRRYPLDKLKELGIEDYSRFVDEDDLIQDAISTDGAAHFITSYDGNERNIRYKEKLYSIFRRD